MDWKVGEIKQVNGEWYQCAEGLYCDDCAFVNDNCEDRERITLREKLTKQPTTGFCNSEKRNDKTSVIFKKLEKVGEPYVGNNGTFQSYKLAMPIYGDIPDQIIGFTTTEVVIKQNKEDMEEGKLDPHMEKVIDEAAQKLGDEISKQLKENLNKQRMKPFNLEAAKAGRPVCTRDERKARVICFDRITNTTNEYTGHLIVLVTNPNGDEQSFYYTEKGNLASEDEYDNHKYDLMMLPEKKEGWIIVSKNATIYDSLGDAKKSFDSDKELCICKVEWEE